MQILLIEDNSNKLKQIKRVLTEIYPESNIEEAYSFNSGVRKVYENKWNLIILDMSLPTYDITHTESGGDKKPVAGKNIMKRMLNRKIIVPVVIITQFETFDDSRRQKKSLLDGASLRERMVLTNVKNYSKLGEKLNLFKHIYDCFYGC